MEKSNDSNVMYNKIRDLYKNIDQKIAMCEAQRDQIEQIAELLTEARRNQHPHLEILVCKDFFLFFYIFFTNRNNTFSLLLHRKTNLKRYNQFYARPKLELVNI